MMTSYTAQVIAKEPQHSAKTPAYHLGDIVSIYKHITEAPNKSGRLAFIHVHNVPEQVNFENLTKELSRAESLSATSRTETSTKRAWKVELMDLSITDNVANIDWSEAVNLFIRKFDGKTGGEYYSELE